MMWRCGVCGYIHDGDSAPDKCPKCGSPKEKFAQIEAAAAKLIERARHTNHLHMKMAAKLGKVIKIADKGIDDNLDPGCLEIFTKAKEQANILIHSIRAELQGHMNKGKWG